MWGGGALINFTGQILPLDSDFVKAHNLGRLPYLSNVLSHNMGLVVRKLVFGVASE